MLVRCANLNYLANNDTIQTEIVFSTNWSSCAISIQPYQIMCLKIEQINSGEDILDKKCLFVTGLSIVARRFG